MSYKTQPFTCDTPSEFKETVSVTCRYNLNQFIKQSTWGNHTVRETTISLLTVSSEFSVWFPKCNPLTKQKHTCRSCTFDKHGKINDNKRKCAYECDAETVELNERYKNCPWKAFCTWVALSCIQEAKHSWSLLTLAAVNYTHSVLTTIWGLDGEKAWEAVQVRKRQHGMRWLMPNRTC